MSYALENMNGRLNITLSMNADTLTGTTESDIFYGEKGNDTITGTNGRDVAVYDTTSWGKDIIEKTDSPMTILFNGVTKDDVTTKKIGDTMVLTKTGTKETITVQGWSDDTYNIVYAKSLSKFEKYMNATNQSEKVTTAARNEVLKKAGLASA